MLRDTPKENPDLFRSEATRCVAKLPENEWVPFKRLRTVNPLHLFSSVLQIVTGLSLILFAMLGLISPLWSAGLMSLLGSVLTVVGVYLLYETIKKRHSINKLARESVRRIIQDQN